MKKVISVFAVLALFCTLISCTQADSDAMGQTTSTTALNTLTELETYNDSILKQVPETRGLGSGLAIATADILGAARGIRAGQTIAGVVGLASGGTGYLVTSGVCGAICGAGASYAAYAVTKKPKTKPEMGNLLSQTKQQYKLATSDIITHAYTYNTAKDKINLPARYEYLIRIGEDHNGIIAVSDQGKEIEYPLASGNIQNSGSAIPVLSYGFDELDSMIYNNPFFLSQYNGICQDIIQTMNGELSENARYNIDKSPKVNKLLNMFLNVYNKYPKNTNEIAEIVNKYIETIERNNELNDQEKEIVYGSLVVSLYSPQLWYRFR